MLYRPRPQTWPVRRPWPRDLLDVPLGQVVHAQLLHDRHPGRRQDGHHQHRAAGRPGAAQRGVEALCRATAARCVREESERPIAALASIGIAPEAVDYVLITPLQAYATANIHLFTNATVCLSKRGWVEDYHVPKWPMHIPRELRIPDRGDQVPAVRGAREAPPARRRGRDRARPSRLVGRRAPPLVDGLRDRHGQGRRHRHRQLLQVRQRRREHPAGHHGEHGRVLRDLRAAEA